MSKYQTAIDARDSGGNVFTIIGTAKTYLTKLEGREAGAKLMNACTACGSYEEVLELVREYFPVKT